MYIGLILYNELLQILNVDSINEEFAKREMLKAAEHKC